MFRRWKLYRDLRKVNKRYLPMLKKLRFEKAKKEEVDYVEEQFWEQSTWVEEGLRWLDQSRLMRKARRLYVPLPTGKDNWEDLETSLTGRQFLTDAGIRELRLGIREEKKARRDMVVGWITPLTSIIGALAGLMGTLIALIAVWGSK